jgi:hypothetical protein
MTLATILVSSHSISLMYDITRMSDKRNLTTIAIDKANYKALQNLGKTGELQYSYSQTSIASVIVVY